MEPQNEQPAAATSAPDGPPKVTGIGGIFFLAADPAALKTWYSTNLGIEVNGWGGVSFESRDVARPEEVNTLQWMPFNSGDAPFAPSQKEFMINYRVRNIEGLVSQLRANGVTVLDEIATYEYGRFVHLMDGEGTKIELWEPVADPAK